MSAARRSSTPTTSPSARTVFAAAGSSRRCSASLAFASAAPRVRDPRVVLGTLIYKGASQLNLDFFTKARPLFGEKGGVADALVGTALIVGMAMLMAIPVAVLVAIYMSEYAGPRVSRGLSVVLDVLNGVPAIVVGIFVFGLLVVGHGQSAVYGAFALAILMLPMVARATQEILEVVPQSLRDASLALGVTQVADDVEHHPARCDRRDPHGRRHRGRARRRRDGAAPLHVLDRCEPDLDRRLTSAPDFARDDLRQLGVAGPGRAGVRMGRGARAHRLRARDEHPREGLRRPEAASARRLLEASPSVSCQRERRHRRSRAVGRRDALGRVNCGVPLDRYLPDAENPCTGRGDPLNERGTMLLLRHASAGERLSSPGVDRFRRLDEAGRSWRDSSSGHTPIARSRRSSRALSLAASSRSCLSPRVWGLPSTSTGSSRRTPRSRTSDPPRRPPGDDHRRARIARCSRSSSAGMSRATRARAWVLERNGSELVPTLYLAPPSGVVAGQRQAV